MQKVLMIDNAKMMHLAVKARLSEEEIEFRSAYDGFEGLALAESFGPDVILLDVDMPAMNGFEVIRRLKSNVVLSNIPIIFLTAATTTEEKVKGLNLGAVDYVTKPFEPTELQARVRASLRTKYLLDLLAQHAMIDGLTGLWNRAHFDQRLVCELSLIQRTRAPLACVMADIDRFKAFNDTHGHRFGDQILKATARILKEQSRTHDVVCRYGGEEFVILMPGISADGAAVAAERIRQAVAARYFNQGGNLLRVTCSFGVADTHAIPDPSIVERADQALYIAKRSGRDRVSLASADLVSA